MTDPNFVILYVKDPSASAALYADVLGRTPDEASSTFAMFALSSGIKLGAWSWDEVASAADGAAGSAELALTLPDADAVRAAHEIAQPPTKLDFGLAFVALAGSGRVTGSASSHRLCHDTAPHRVGRHVRLAQRTKIK
jgi:catechol 2,3-dioxygenase-like lactoylglutathione lyase family enzyme